MPNLYNIARVRMLGQDFEWTTLDKYLVLLGDGFVFVPNHQTMDQILPVYWEAKPLVTPAITPTGWAGSPPVMFQNLLWPEPVYRALLTQVTGDPLDPANHRLICDLDNVIQAPFVTDSFDKQVGFDTSTGAEGWFAP